MRVLVSKHNSRFYNLQINYIIFITDVSVRNKMAIIITTWDGDLHTEMLDLVRCVDATAEGLHTALIKALEASNLEPSKMVGFAADTCNVMFGERNSVTQRLKLQLPKLLAVKCSCHSIHLVSSKAFSLLPTQVYL